MAICKKHCFWYYFFVIYFRLVDFGLPYFQSFGCGMQSSAELMKEIATLEIEIMHLERYLLSLYRTALEQHFPNTLENYGTQLHCKIGSPLQTTTTHLCHKMEPNMWKGGTDHYNRIFPAQGLTCSDDQSDAASTKSSSRRVNASPPKYVNCRWLVYIF